MFRTFDLEIWQSEHEQNVRYELADSGVHPLTLRELEGLGFDAAALLDLPLRYPEVNGTRLLRERIAALYPGLGADEILVTVGAAEAGAIAIAALTEAGEKVAFMRPNYQQLPGIAVNLGRSVATFSLDPATGWRLDLDELERACAGATVVSVCNPNNPTGHVLSAAEREAVVAACARHGAWLLADEVYIGTELDGEETPTFLEHGYDRTIVISSLSKAYGLSGLRVGWVAGPRDAVAACWRRHEYATISTTAPSMLIAEFALSTPRAKLFARNRGYIVAGQDAIADWALQHDQITVERPQATPVTFVRLGDGVSSLAFARRLLQQESVLVAPGEYFGGFNEHVRITSALELTLLSEALDRIARQLGSPEASSGR